MQELQISEDIEILSNARTSANKQLLEKIPVSLKILHLIV